jgi:glutathione synthase/RimK-type ligase-like ATP-grasp enzyme
MNKHVKIAIGKDTALWHEKFVEAIANRCNDGFPAEYKVVNMERHDWLQVATPYDVVIWKPEFMGPQSASQFQAKVYFLETYCKKLVVPNFKTIWHFENKIAQAYLFQIHEIPTPKTTVSFDYHDAIDCLRRETFPLVFKKPHGAGSRNVKLVSTFSQAENIVTNIFSHQLWMESKTRSSSKTMFLLLNLSKHWLWFKLFQKFFRDEYFKAVYWQNFIPDNESDLRITVIGDRYAFGFWRNNRPNDFRASGSGRIDYQRAVPENLLHYCIKINRDLCFDSMAYDILFSNNNFFITEISYGYLDSAIYTAAGYYELQKDNKLEFIKGHFWPQELWVNWMFDRVARMLYTQET